MIYVLNVIMKKDSLRLNYLIIIMALRNAITIIQSQLIFILTLIKNIKFVMKHVLLVIKEVMNIQIIVFYVTNLI